MGWNGFALSMHAAAALDPATGRPASGEVSATDRDARVAAGLGMLGDPENAEDVKFTVPAGSVVIKHNDLWHRVSRSGTDGITNVGVPWRPMFSATFNRGSEPQASSMTVDDAGGGGGEVWGSTLSWLHGGRGGLKHGPLPMLTADAIEGLSLTMITNESERERVTAATQLGNTCRDELTAPTGVFLGSFYTIFTLFYTVWYCFCAKTDVFDSRCAFTRLAP